MAKQELKQVKSILNGQSPTVFFMSEGQYLSSVGIDPDIPLPNTPLTNRAAGVITPSSYIKFTSTVVNSAPMWIVTNPKNALIYSYLSNGRFVSHSSSFTDETNIGTPTSGAGNGMAYYNNYIYIATPTDVARYGPLNGSPSLTNTVWSGSTLGTQTALTNTTYPIFQEYYPNHPMHVHSNNILYFGDFANGQGMIHAIKTKKVTVEGDTNDGSAYNVLDLPFGYMPMDIESYGTSLAILAIQTNDSGLNQGNAAMFLWDTIKDTFYRQVPLSDPLATALINKNGQLYVFSGNRNTGFRVSRYLDGYSLEDVDYFEEGYSPFAGAVDVYGSRLAWGGVITEPTGAGCIFSLGSKNAKLPNNARHVPIRSSSAGANRVITAFKFAQQASGVFPRGVIGWKDDSATGMDKLSGSSYNAIFRTQVFTVEQTFNIDNIRIPLSNAVTANTNVVVKIYYDYNTIKTLNTINNTNYSGQSIIEYKSQEIDEATTASYRGQHHFFLEFTMTGSDGNSILLPIDINLTLLDD